jgi:hypothetical protein
VLHVAPRQSALKDSKALEAVERTGLPLGLPAVTFQPLTNNNPAEDILQVIAEGGFEMVALIARPRSFLGALSHRSVTAEVLHSQCRYWCPLLTRLPVGLLSAS